MLVDWVNPMYLDTGVVKDVRARFKDESEIQLQEFLLVNGCHVLPKLIYYKPEVSTSRKSTRRSRVD